MRGMQYPSRFDVILPPAAPSLAWQVDANQPSVRKTRIDGGEVPAIVPPSVPNLAWLDRLSEPVKSQRTQNYFQAAGLVSAQAAGTNTGWLQALAEPVKRRAPIFEQPAAVFPPLTVVQSLGWLDRFAEPVKPRAFRFDLQASIFVPAQAGMNIGWLAPLAEPQRRPRRIDVAPESVFFQPAPSIAPLSWLAPLAEPQRRPWRDFVDGGLVIAPLVQQLSTAWLAPLADPQAPRRNLSEGFSATVTAPFVVPLSFGWFDALSQPIPSRKVLVDADGNVYFIPAAPGPAFGFNNLAWLIPLAEPVPPRKPLPEYPFAFLGYSPQRYAALVATLLADIGLRKRVVPLRLRNRLADATSRVRVVTFRPNRPMSQANDLSPAIDAGEEETIGFDFGPALALGETLIGQPIIAVSVSALSGTATDPNPQSCLLSAPTLVSSTRTKAAQGQWNVLFGGPTLVPNVVYLLSCLTTTSNGQKLLDWVRFPASAPY